MDRSASGHPVPGGMPVAAGAVSGVVVVATAAETWWPAATAMSRPVAMPAAGMAAAGMAAAAVAVVAVVAAFAIAGAGRLAVAAVVGEAVVGEAVVGEAVVRVVATSAAVVPAAKAGVVAETVVMAAEIASRYAMTTRYGLRQTVASQGCSVRGKPGGR